EGAFLHHACAAHGHVGIELQIQRRRPLRHEPVESTHLVRTVVFAIARADASIVYLAVEPFLSVIRREHRADRLARRVIALLTQHWREVELRRLRRFLWLREVTLDPNPRHDSAVVDAFLTDPWNIVFRVAR